MGGVLCCQSVMEERHHPQLEIGRESRRWLLARTQDRLSFLLSSPRRQLVSELLGCSEPMSSMVEAFVPLAFG